MGRRDDGAQRTAGQERRQNQGASDRQADLRALEVERLRQFEQARREGTQGQ